MGRREGAGGPSRVGRVVSPHVAGLAPTIGRDTELRDLRAAFRTNRIQVLTGMGGVGKTSLARAYAQRHLADYGVVWWVRAEDASAVDAEFRALLEILLPPGQAAQIVNARTATFAQLAIQKAPWLLVLDNVPDAEAAHGLLPPTDNGHILITTRFTAWPDPTSIKPLDLKAAVELLTDQSGDRDRTTAEAVARELGALPLALTQAAGFVRANAIDLATYLRLYRDRSAELHEEGRPADYPHTVATTWQLAMERLTQPAREMLNVLAFYAPDAIPVRLLFTAMDELARHRAIGELHAHSLISPAEPEAITVHRLVQAVTRDRLGPHTYEWVDKARELLVAAAPEPPVTAISLSVWNALRTHFYALFDNLPPEHPDTMSGRHLMAAWTGEAGDAAGARDLLAELLPIEERVLGAEHPETLATRHHKAYWTGELGDAEGARTMLGDLLPIRIQVLGREHPDTLTTQHNLAYWTGEAGDPARARDLFAELLAIEARVLGAEHPETLTTRSNLAGWTGEAGDPARARDLFAELAAIEARVLGNDHPDVLLTLSNLAGWTGEAGDPAKARDLYLDLAPIRERVLGAEHPSTLHTRHNLARWTGEAGNPRRAWELLVELVPICERALGTEHTYTAAAMADLAYWGELAGGPEG